MSTIAERIKNLEDSKLSTTATIDYTTIDGGGQLTINAGVGDSQPVTLTGVTQADYSVKCEAVGGLPMGLTIADCYVSANDEVTIVLFNLSGSPIDPPSIDFKIIATRL